MNRDSKAPVIAKVDLSKVRLIDESKLGIDFFNEIDIWAQMEFRSRDQSQGRKRSPQILATRPYSVREKLG
jgi:hypothetical protein